MTTIHRRVYCSKNSVPVSQASPLANLFPEAQRNRFRSFRLFSQRDSPIRASFCLTIVSQAQPFPARAIHVLSQGWSVLLLLTTNLFINSVCSFSLYWYCCLNSLTLHSLSEPSLLIWKYLTHIMQLHPFPVLMFKTTCFKLFIARVGRTLKSYLSFKLAI